MRDNVHTWARLARLDLQNLSVSLGNAALQERPNWPKDGSGRAIKATTEKITRTLDRTFDRRDLNFSFDVIEDAISLFEEIADYNFFKDFISHKTYADRKNNTTNYGSAISEGLAILKSYILSNRPPRDMFAKESGSPRIIIPDIREETLGDVIPSQHAAPIQFAVLSGKLQVRRQNARPSAEDRHLLTMGKNALLNDATSIINTLGETNADPRLSVALCEIRDTLASDADIIRLGMLTTTCDSLVRRFSEQIPEIAGAKLEAFGINLTMFVNHFPEWQKFTLQASASEVLDAADIATIYKTAIDFVQHLKVDNQIVDPQVPKSLQILLETIREPTTARKRAVYAVVRTLENLVGAIFSGFGGLFGAGFAGLKEGLKTSAKVATIAFLLGAAAHAAGSLSPAAARIIKSDWMEKASQIVRKALEPE